MTEYRIVTFTQPISALSSGLAGSVTSLTVDFSGSVPELASQMDGWEVVNAQVVPAGDNVLMTFFLRTEVSVPDAS